MKDENILFHPGELTTDPKYFKICIYIYIYIYMQISLNIIDISVYIFSSGSVRIPVLLLSYSGEIDLCIVHSCMY